MNNSHTMLPLEKYKELLEITPVCAVDVLFFNSDKTKTLLFKRENEPLKGVYFSMGGRLQKGERLEDCAVRKAFEETGLNINKENLIWGGTIEEIHTNSIFEGTSYHAVDLYFGYILEKEEKLVLDSQHNTYEWFSVLDDSLHPFIKTKVNNLLKQYGQKP